MRWPVLLLATPGLICLAEDAPTFHSVEQFEKTPFFKKLDLAKEQDWTNDAVNKRVVRYITSEAKKADKNSEVRVTLRYVTRMGVFDLSAFSISIMTPGDQKMTPDQRVALLKSFVDLNDFNEKVKSNLYRELEAAEKDRNNDDVIHRFAETVKGVETNIHATRNFIYLGFSLY